MEETLGCFIENSGCDLDEFVESLSISEELSELIETGHCEFEMYGETGNIVKRVKLILSFEEVEDEAN